MINTSIELSEGESILIPCYPNSNPCREMEAELARKHIDVVMSTPVLKAMGIAGYKSHVTQAFFDNMTGCYNDLRNNPVLYHCRTFYHEEFNQFLHKLLSSPKIREVCFSLFSNAVCDICAFYPKDYKQSILGMLRSAKAYVAEMPKHVYEFDDSDAVLSEKRLYIDGKQNEELAMGIEGFLIRRVLFDKFSIEELSNYLNSLISAVSKVDVSKNADYLECKTINDNLQYRVTATGNYYYAPKSGRSIFPYSQVLDWPSRYGCSKILFSGDGYYRITNGYVSKMNGSELTWEEYTHPDVKGMMVVDDSGEIIYRE